MNQWHPGDPVTELDNACSAAGLEYHIAVNTATDCAWSAEVITRPAGDHVRASWEAVPGQSFYVAGCARPEEALDAACHAATLAVQTSEKP